MANAQLEHQFIPTSRGGRYLCLNGFMYRVGKRKAGDWISWKCKDKDCSATISTVNDIVTKKPGPHNHQPVHNEMKVKELMANLKVKASSSMTPMQTLYDEEISTLRDGAWTAESRELIQSVPTFTTKKDALYRARRKTMPQLPKHRRDLVIPDAYRTTETGEQFLMIDDGVDNRILGFSTPTNLDHLCAASTMYGDGTFYVTPVIFYQLYTLHAMVGQKMTPLVFLLLPDKKKQTYERAFGLLKQKAADLGYQLDPQTIQMDFEVAARSASRTVFPTSEWKGCFFHFTQCVWRRTEQLDLQVDYREDAEVTRFVRRCAVLPLVPTHLIDTVWLQTMADMPNDARCTQLADYMTINWLDGDLALHLWNHHDNDGPRTNNHLEGWHGRIKKLICKAHPNIYELLTFLLDEQKKNELNMVQYEAGQRLPPKKKKYEDMKRRFLALRDRLTRNEIDVINFADASSYLLKL